MPSEIPRYEEQLEKFVDTVDPLIEHAPAKLLEFAKAGKNQEWVALGAELITLCDISWGHILRPISHPGCKMS